jgi:peptidoglycan L-alanyl-D-glutamate endopeptidase CwlK
MAKVNRFSKASQTRLETCHKDLQYICKEVLKVVDIIVIEGYRARERQNELVEMGYSKLMWPKSKHNRSPSDGVDIAIWHKTRPHIHWDDREEFIYLAGLVKGIASQHNIKVRCGADWNGDGVFNEGFFDGAHVERIG